MTARAVAVTLFDPAGTPGNVPQRYFDVIVVPHLASASAWYLMGDPATSPTLGLLHLGATPDARTLRIERIPAPMSTDGIGVAVRNEFKISRMSRIGIVKVTA